ncbi:MAG: hypothetical protein OXI60_02855 [Acidiferrobacterales bacterium]|nr:hypothetical protein [Acidiferrobacterales bacterium]
MNVPTELNDVEFVGVYVVPGEAPVAALKDLAGTQLFDRQGLTWRIQEKRKIGRNSKAEEQALAIINEYDESNNGLS